MIVDAIQGVTNTAKQNHSTENKGRDKPLNHPFAKTVDTNKICHPFFSLEEQGVFYHRNEESRWICARLEIKAFLRDKTSENWGRLLVFSDADHQVHTWAMPMEMIKGSGEELRGELLRLGLEIAPGMRARQLLIEYITTTKPTERARFVTRTGWYDSVFVLPSRTIGNTSETVIYQSENQSRDYQQAGTL